jgi:hypothetical protein
MAGLLIFIGIGIIVTTILKTQARRARQKPESDRLRELHERLRRGGDVGDTGGIGTGDATRRQDQLDDDGPDATDGESDRDQRERD